MRVPQLPNVQIVQRVVLLRHLRLCVLEGGCLEFVRHIFTAYKYISCALIILYMLKYSKIARRRGVILHCV